MELSVVIVSYNVKYFLEQCLHSVSRALSHIRGEVFVVDNNSSDGSVEYLSAKFPQYIYINNYKNQGFGKACNQALPLAKGKYVLFLNPDTIIAENSLSECLEFLKSHNDAGALGCRMIDGSGIFLPESKRSFPSLSASFFKLTGISSAFPKSKWFNQYALGFLDENANHNIDVLCGAFLMVRKQVLTEVGGFDEAFFMYAEDIDLSYRIKKAGYNNYYYGGTSIIHFKGESSKQDNAKHLHSFYDAMKIFVRKHYKNKSAGMLTITLTTAIASRWLLSMVRLPVAAFLKKQPVKTTKLTILVGSKEATSALFAKAAALFKGKTIKQLNSITGEIDKEPSAFVFCIGQFTNSQSIQLLGSALKGQQCMWHHSHSGSIVGSTDKNKSGEAYGI